MQKPQEYDSTQAFTGEFESIALGGHVCVIKGARVEEINGIDYLVLAFDIAPGDPQSGYYQRQFDRKKADNPATKWGGTYRQGTDGKGVSFFKGLVKSIEESNSGYKWNWDETTLVGKRFGGVFGREEYTGSDGTSKFATKCVQIRSVDAVQKGVEIPKDKMLKAAKGSSGFTEVKNAVLPF